MSEYIIYNGELYHADELYHHGVKGMKWGRRKARPVATGMGRRGGTAQDQTATDPVAAKEARRAKAKKCAKIGAAVVGTAIAAYGVYKVGEFANYHYQRGSSAMGVKMDLQKRIGNVGNSASNAYYNAKAGASKLAYRTSNAAGNAAMKGLNALSKRLK